MGSRTKARKAAVDLLFEADQREVNVRDLLAARLAGTGDVVAPREYTVEVVEGVVDHWTTINEALTTYSLGWTLERMPAVDRAVLRLAAYEILFRDDVADAVAIAEAVRLVTELSTAQSPAFVNGLLGRITEIKPTIVESAG